MPTIYDRCIHIERKTTTMNDINNTSEAIDAISTALNNRNIESLDKIEETIIRDTHLFDFADKSLLNLIKTTRTAIENNFANVERIDSLVNDTPTSDYKKMVKSCSNWNA